MRFSKTMGVVVLVIAAMSLALAPKAGATITDERTVMTFNQPIEIPGVLLPAGTYVFKVVDLPAADRSVIQVLDGNEKRIYGTYLTLHVTRLGKEPAVTFAERPAGAPRAIAAWFPLHAAQSANDAGQIFMESPTTGSFSWIPNEGTDGHEFMYSKKEILTVAALIPAAPQPVAPPAASPAPVEESAVVPEQPAPAPATATEPAPAPAEEPMVAQNNNTEQQQTAPPQAMSDQPATLPKTASSLPLVGLIGLISLAAAFSLLIVARRAS